MKRRSFRSTNYAAQVGTNRSKSLQVSTTHVNPLLKTANILEDCLRHLSTVAQKWGDKAGLGLTKEHF